MKHLPDIKVSRSHTIQPSLRPRRMTAAGFTLVEMMIALAVFTFIVGGMVAVQIFGLRIYTLASTKLIATTDGRETMNYMRDQIRESQQVYVGTFSNSSFVQANGQQIGNALQIFTTTNTASTNFTVFYMDPSTNEVFCYTNTPAILGMVAQYMTNYNCFQAEDFQGNILTNYQNNPVIRVTLSFSQWEYPIGFIGSNAVNAYDFYFLRTRITRRCKQ
jgi:prepilin-type N-terminal cleavage/methylation domain-containing protein